MNFLGKTRDRRGGRQGRLLLPAALASCLCGCSVAYLEKDGTRYHFGAAESRELGSRSGDSGVFQTPPAQVQAFGLSLIEFADGYGLTLGWTRVRQGLLANRVAPDSPQGPAGMVVSVESLGLALTRLGADTGLKLGYGRDALVSLGSNVFVLGNPVVALDAASDRDGVR